jgi:hypothetical protein
MICSTSYLRFSIGIRELASRRFLRRSMLADLKDALFTLIFVALTIPVYFLTRACKVVGWFKLAG